MFEYGTGRVGKYIKLLELARFLCTIWRKSLTLNAELFLNRRCKMDEKRNAPLWIRCPTDCSNYRMAMKIKTAQAMERILYLFSRS